MDWTLAFVGGMIVLLSLPGLLNPYNRIGTVDGWRKRLSELESGAPEAFFEERRQLEVYPPSANATPKRMRIVSAFGIICGIILLILAFNK